MQNDVFNAIRKVLHDNSPAILTSIGVAGTAITAYLTGKASYTAAQVIMRKEEDLERTQDPLTLTEKLKLVGTLYIPAGITGALTIASIISANKVNASRTAALAAAYSVTERAFDEYKVKVVEQLGPRKEERIRDEIAQDRVNASSKGQMLVLGDGKVLCYEQYTGRYFESDMESLKKAMNSVNADVINELYATLNDFYHMIGLPQTTNSANLGWNSDRLMELEFSSTLAEDGRPCLAFQYNYVKAV